MSKIEIATICSLKLKCAAARLSQSTSIKILLFSIEKRFSKEPSFDLLLESGSTYFADRFLVKSDVEQEVAFDPSDKIASGFSGSSGSSVEVRKMACAPRRLSPLADDPAPPFTGEGITLDPDQDIFVKEGQDTTNYGNLEYLLINVGNELQRSWKLSR